MLGLKAGPSEKGALQAIFDLRFACAVLACGDPDFSGKGAVSTPSSVLSGHGRPYRRSAGSASDALSSLIDPIDWATYEPLLVANERRCYQRSAVMLGSFTRLERIAVSSAETSTNSSMSGATDLTPAMAPRFSYLPISMPVLTAGMSNGEQGRKKGGRVLEQSKGGAGSVASEALSGLYGLMGQGGQIGSQLEKGWLGGLAGLTETVTQLGGGLGLGGTLQGSNK